MAKESRRENRRNRDGSSIRPDESGSRWFIAVILLLVVAGGAIVALFATQRESIAGVAPEAGIDHWHDAYLIHGCGTDFPASVDTDGDEGIHTHGSGLIHIHPSNPAGAGPNATFGVFLGALGAELTDDTYIPGAGEVQVTLSEADGCDGEDAVLQLAYWADAWSEDDPVIITENIADFRFDASQGSAITLALLPEGAPIPKPPAERLDLLESTNGGRN